MEDFKKIVKMKVGGSVSSEYCGGGKTMKKKAGGTVDKADIAQDKKIVKKAFGMHDDQLHEGERTDLSKLKKGGRAKKEIGTVRKYKEGGAIEMKKSSGDLDKIKAVKATGNKKAEAPSKGSVKEKDTGAKTSAPSGHKDAIKKVTPTGDKKADAPSKGEAKGKDIKKFADGNQVIAQPGLLQRIGRRLRNNVMGTPEQNAAAAARMAAAQQAQPMQAPMTPATPQTPMVPQTPDQSQAPATGLPAQKRGGRVGKK